MAQVVEGLRTAARTGRGDPCACRPGDVWCQPGLPALDVSQPARKAARSPSPVSTATALRVGVPGRPVLCLVPPAHLTLSAAPPASRLLTHPISPIDTVLYRHRPFTRPKPLRRVERSSPTISTCLTYPSRFQNPMCHTPHAPPEVTWVGLTAPSPCTPFGGCDDEHPQA